MKKKNKLQTSLYENRISSSWILLEGKENCLKLVLSYGAGHTALYYDNEMTFILRPSFIFYFLGRIVILLHKTTVQNLYASYLHVTKDSVHFLFIQSLAWN
jgi:hypothetical protein